MERYDPVDYSQLPDLFDIEAVLSTNRNNITITISITMRMIHTARTCNMHAHARAPYSIPAPPPTYYISIARGGAFISFTVSGDTVVKNKGQLPLTKWDRMKCYPLNLSLILLIPPILLNHVSPGLASKSMIRLFDMHHDNNSYHNIIEQAMKYKISSEDVCLL